MSAWFKIIDPSDGSELTEGTGNKTINIKRLKENTGREDYEENVTIISKSDSSVRKKFKVKVPKAGLSSTGIPNTKSGTPTAETISFEFETNADPSKIQFAMTNFAGDYVASGSNGFNIQANFFNLEAPETYESNFTLTSSKTDFSRVPGVSDDNTTVGGTTSSSVHIQYYVDGVLIDHGDQVQNPGPIYTGFFSGNPEIKDSTPYPYRSLVNSERAGILGKYSTYKVKFEFEFSSSSTDALYKQGVLLYLGVPKLSGLLDYYVIPVYREASDTPILKIFKDGSYSLEVSDGETLTITEETTPLWIQTNTSWMASIIN